MLSCYYALCYHGQIALAIELYKVTKGWAPDIMNVVFPLKESRNYCTNFPFKTRNIRTVTYGSETLSFLGPKIWSLIPSHIKSANTLDEFKNKIKNWKPENCPCKLCKIYISGVGFINVAP